MIVSGIETTASRSNRGHHLPHKKLMSPAGARIATVARVMRNARLSCRTGMPRINAR